MINSSTEQSTYQRNDTEKDRERERERERKTARDWMVTNKPDADESKLWLQPSRLHSSLTDDEAAPLDLTCLSSTFPTITHLLPLIWQLTSLHSMLRHHFRQRSQALSTVQLVIMTNLLLPTATYNASRYTDKHKIIITTDMSNSSQAKFVSLSLHHISMKTSCKLSKPYSCTVIDLWGIFTCVITMKLHNVKAYINYTGLHSMESCSIPFMTWLDRYTSAL